MLVLSLCSIAVSNLHFSSFSQGDHHQQAKSKAFQFELLDAIDDLSFVGKTYSGILDTAGFEGLLKNHLQLHKKCEAKGVGVYVYESGNLKFWSSNHFVVPDDEVKKGFSSEVNGIYYYDFIKKGEQVIWLQLLIKKRYDFENDYVTNSFNQTFSIVGDFDLSLEHPILLHENQFLEVLKIKNEALYLTTNHHYAAHIHWLSIVFEVLGLLIISAFLYSWPFANSSRLVELATWFLMMSCALMLVGFDFFPYLFQLWLFDPAVLAISKNVPSLGHLLLYLSFALLLFKKTGSLTQHLLLKKGFVKTTVLTIVAVLWVAFSHFVHTTSKAIVTNSEIPFDFTNVLSLSYQSIVSMFTICLLVLAYSYFVWLVLKRFSGKILYYLGVCFSLVSFIAIPAYEFESLLWLVFCGLALGWRGESVVRFKFFISLVLVCLASALITKALKEGLQENKTAHKKILLNQLGKENDLIAEYLFEGIQQEILCSDSVYNLASDYDLPIAATKKYLDKNVFKGFWDKYDVQVNPCFKGDSLVFAEGDAAVYCDDFFNQIISKQGTRTNGGLYHLSNDNGRISYLGVIEFDQGGKLFLEFDSKFKPNAIGFPTLLLDKQIERKSLSNQYAFAHYQNGNLVRSKGGDFYPLTLEGIPVLEDETWQSLALLGVDHFVKVSGDDVYLLSELQETIWDQLSFFSYVLLFIGFCSLFVWAVWRLKKNERTLRFSFKMRFQVVIIALLFVTTVLIGAASIGYLKSQFNDENKAAIQEKIQSVKIALANDQFFTTALKGSDEVEVNFILERYAQMFFTDINVFNVEGDLIESSQNEVFSKGLLASKINPLAIQKLLLQGRQQLIQTEQIEGLNYQSAYIPFLDEASNFIGYINLPYFAKSGELENKISNFIVALLNIYVLLILIALGVGVLVTNQLTKPLRLIQSKFANVQLLGTNEVIKYKGKDEIGQLINQYNRTVAELGESAKKIADSERQDAWREMAKQVAHEIKNPLTPMKLSLQHLQMRWGSFNSEDKDERFAYFAQNLVQQIDTLTAIANEFSSFAKLPDTKFERILFDEVLRSTVDIYNGMNDVRVLLDNELHTFINGDRDQLIRVFNNVIKNAIQAIPETKSGIVKVVQCIEGNNLVIVVSDNGSGIPIENQSRIFTPNFTTKNSGMGLGLAMVQKIIENMNGSISFSTTIGEGTDFKITFPVD